MKKQVKKKVAQPGLVKKKEVEKKQVNEKPTRDVLKVYVEYISGQSMLPWEAFKGKYYYPDDFDTIASSVVEVIKSNFPNEVREELFIYCKDERLEQLKLSILYGVARKEKFLRPTTKINRSGSNWGINVFIKIEKEEFDVP